MLKALILFIVVSYASCKDTSPVIILDPTNLLIQWNLISKPFQTIQADHFHDLAVDSLRARFVIIFVEHSLCTEDITTKDFLGTPYKNLRESLLRSEARYLPSVMTPYTVVSDVFPVVSSHEVSLTKNKKFITPKDHNYLYVYFSDILNGTRTLNLRLHDDALKGVYSEVVKTFQGPIIAYYLGRWNPVAIKTSSPPKAAKSNFDDVMITSGGAMLRLTGVSVATPKRRFMFRNAPRVTDESVYQDKMVTTVAYVDLDLQFNFEFQDRGWLLDSVALLEGGEEVGRTVMRVGAPWRFSYICSEPLVVVNVRDGSTVAISKYQLEPRLIRQDPEPGAPADPDAPPGESTGSGSDAGDGGAPADGYACWTSKFSDSVSCGPYFNSHILSGLTVTAVVLSILTGGVLVLMDCKTNSKFDDPQGKEVFTASDMHDMH